MPLPLARFLAAVSIFLVALFGVGGILLVLLGVILAITSR